MWVIDHSYELQHQIMQIKGSTKCQFQWKGPRILVIFFVMITQLITTCQLIKTMFYQGRSITPWFRCITIVDSTLFVSTYGGTLGTLGDSFIPVRFSKREFGKDSQLFQRLEKLSCLAKFDCVLVLRLRLNLIHKLCD